MTGRRRDRHTGRSEKGSFLLLPHAVLNCPNYLALSRHGRSLLVDLAAQFKGYNNGDQCAAWTLMERRGWRSRDTLHWALCELRHYGFIQQTRQGGLNRPSLYALTWHPVDECRGKLDTPPTNVSSGLWREPRPKFERPLRRRKNLEGQHAQRVSPTRQAV